MNEKKLQKVKELLILANESLSVADFEKAVKSLISLVLKIDKKLTQKIDTKGNDKVAELQKLITEFEKVVDKAKKETDTSLSAFKTRTVEAINNLFTKSRVSSQLKDILNRHNEKVRELEITMSNIVDGTNGTDGIDGKDGSSDKPEEVRDKLETLTGKKRLDVSAIKGLEEFMKKIEKLASKKIIVGGSSGGTSGGRSILSYDLSPVLDGVTKKFSLPTFWRIIMIQSSSFPNAFRETTDYVTDANLMTVEFTSEISASSTLAAGQTITVLFSEP